MQKSLFVICDFSSIKRKHFFGLCCSTGVDCDRKIQALCYPFVTSWSPPPKATVQSRLILATSQKIWLKIYKSSHLSYRNWKCCSLVVTLALQTFLLVLLFPLSNLNLNRKPTSPLTKADWNVTSSPNTGSAQAARMDLSLWAAWHMTRTVCLDT